MTSFNLVPRQAVSFDEIAKLAETQGWTLDRRFLKEAEYEDSPEYRWQLPDGGDVTLVESASLEHDYIVVDSNVASHVIDTITSKFPCYKEDELVQDLLSATTRETRINTLHAIAASHMSTMNETVHRVIAESLKDQDPRIRLAALSAAFHLKWRQLQPLVREASEREESESVRTVGRHILGMTDWSRG